MLPTPDYKLEKEGDVYSPAEDTFLLLDAIEQEVEVIFFIYILHPLIKM